MAVSADHGVLCLFAQLIRLTTPGGMRTTFFVGMDHRELLFGQVVGTGDSMQEGSCVDSGKIGCFVLRCVKRCCIEWRLASPSSLRVGSLASCSVAEPIT